MHVQSWIRLLSLVQVYERWEGDYRHKILILNMAHIDLNGKMKKPKLCDTRFGNLRHVRNNFLHNRGLFAGDEPDELFEDMTGFFEKDRPTILTAQLITYLQKRFFVIPIIFQQITFCLVSHSNIWTYIKKAFVNRRSKARITQNDMINQFLDWEAYNQSTAGDFDG